MIMIIVVSVVFASGLRVNPNARGADWLGESETRLEALREAQYQ